ncbi:MAG: hypothetical protein CR994_02395 [Maribacter sp.]|nr:MAG: hypothetical protein CR994_02395 [Maribacter sp.]
MQMVFSIRIQIKGGDGVKCIAPQDISYNSGYAKVDPYVIGRQNVYLQRTMQASLMLSSNRKLKLGSSGIILLASVVVIWFLVNGQSFLGVIWESITR